MPGPRRMPSERPERRFPAEPRCPRCGETLTGLDADLAAEEVAHLTLCYDRLLRWVSLSGCGRVA